MSTQKNTEDEFFKKLCEVARSDRRYKLDALLFVYEALDYTVREVVREKRHVTGKELLEGIRQYALKNFGVFSKLVFNSWGVKETQDFGNIVFSLVERGLMKKTESDSIDDFMEVFDFDSAFTFEEYEKFAGKQSK